MIKVIAVFALIFFVFSPGFAKKTSVRKNYVSQSRTRKAASKKVPTIKSLDIIIKSKDKRIKHRYTLLKRPGHKKAVLVFNDGKKKRTRAISAQVAQFFESQTANMIWDSLLRVPANKSAGQCPGYILLKAGKSVSKICKNDKRNTRKALDLVNGFHKVFKK